MTLVQAPQMGTEPVGMVVHHNIEMNQRMLQKVRERLQASRDAAGPTQLSQLQESSTGDCATGPSPRSVRERATSMARRLYDTYLRPRELSVDATQKSSAHGPDENKALQNDEYDSSSWQSWDGYDSYDSSCSSSSSSALLSNEATAGSFEDREDLPWLLGSEASGEQPEATTREALSENKRLHAKWLKQLLASRGKERTRARESSEIEESTSTRSPGSRNRPAPLIVAL